MTTVVAIFDAAEQVEDAVNRLATAGLDAAVVDETSLSQEPGSIDPVGPAVVPGAAAEIVAGKEEPNLIPSGIRMLSAGHSGPASTRTMGCLTR
jgi:hypothetical protein